MRAVLVSACRNGLTRRLHFVFLKLFFLDPQTSPITLPIFLLRPRKWAKKKGAARRGAGFSVNHLRGTSCNSVAYAPIWHIKTMVLDGLTRKNPRHHRRADVGYSREDYQSVSYLCRFSLFAFHWQLIANRCLIIRKPTDRVKKKPRQRTSKAERAHPSSDVYRCASG